MIPMVEMENPRRKGNDVVSVLVVSRRIIVVIVDHVKVYDHIKFAR